MTLKDFNRLKEILDEFNICYDEGFYYTDGGYEPAGRWLEINQFVEIKTDEI